MVFSIEEIANYLKKHSTIESAIENLSETSICEENKDAKSYNFMRNDENLRKYQAKIGMTRLIEMNNTLRLNSEKHGEKGKIWMALTPKWIDEETKKRMKTEYDIMYWVNYADTVADNTYGWFPVEEIMEWLSDKTNKIKLAQISERHGRNK